jgi:polar amino acid transport system substrate-binding protein
MQNNNFKLNHIVLSLMLAVALAGCSALPQSIRNQINIGKLLKTEPTPAAIRAAPIPTPVPAGITTAEVVRRRGKLRVGMRYDAPPLSFVNERGDLEGLDLDIAREFAKRWLGSADKVEFIQVTQSSAPQKLATHEIDMAMGSFLHSATTEEVADFSITYYEDGDAILVRNAIKDVRDLARRSVGWIDTDATFTLRDLQNNNAMTVTMQSMQSYTAAVKELKAGKLAGVVGNWRRLRLEANRDPDLTILSVLNRYPVGILLPENDSAWQGFVNFTLSKLFTDGTYNTLHRKWLGSNMPALAKPLPGDTDLQLSSLPSNLVIKNTLESIKTNKVLKVGISSPNLPFAGWDFKNDALGYEVEIIVEIVRRFPEGGRVEFVDLKGGSLTDAMKNGVVDMGVGGIIVTPANERLFDFSYPIFTPSANITGPLARFTAPVGLVISENDSALRDAINLNLQSMQADSSLKRIAQKWLKTAPPTIEIWAP